MLLVFRPDVGRKVRKASRHRIMLVLVVTVILITTAVE